MLPDPYFMGGGAMITTQGGYLNIHVDFNWNQKLQLWRRCNVLFYLTQNWKKEYNGNIDLYDKKINIVKSYQPIAKRIVHLSYISLGWDKNVLDRPLQIHCTCPSLYSTMFG